MAGIVRYIKGVLRAVAAVAFVSTGILHFAHPQFFRRIVPPGFPSPVALVAISGFFEIAGGVGLLFRPLRRAAGWGLIALLIAVFPANIYMVVNPQRTADGAIPMWALWVRLPMQGLFIAWVWFVALGEGKSEHESARIDTNLHE
jgi:uncharacterized membrane protein